jgi:hypothetical protein
MYTTNAVRIVAITATGMIRSITDVRIWAGRIMSNTPNPTGAWIGKAKDIANEGICC